jgi:hypothetical protein
MWWLLGFLVVAMLVAIAVFMRKGGLKAEKQNLARRKADAIINKQRYASQRKINRLINSIKRSNEATHNAITEEDLIRIEKLREIRESR